MPTTLFHTNAGLRPLGLAAAAVGTWCLGLLFDGHVAPMTLPGCIIAAAGFLGCSGGTALLVLGTHLHDRVPVTRPWGAALSTGQHDAAAQVGSFLGREPFSWHCAAVT